MAQVNIKANEDQFNHHPHFHPPHHNSLSNNNHRHSHHHNHQYQHHFHNHQPHIHHHHLHNQQKHQLHLQHQRQQHQQQSHYQQRDSIQQQTFDQANNSQKQSQLQLQLQQPQPQQYRTTNQQHQLMAHYKFHNDCQSSVLTYEQVKRLDYVMDQVVPIHGRGNFPTLFVKLKELIRLVKHKLQTEHNIEISDVRLNGGAASYILAPENSHYNDLDLIFATELSTEERFDVIRDVVLECLKEFFSRPSQQPTTIDTKHSVNDTLDQTKQTSQQSTCDVKDNIKTKICASGESNNQVEADKATALEDIDVKNRSYGSCLAQKTNDNGCSPPSLSENVVQETDEEAQKDNCSSLTTKNDIKDGQLTSSSTSDLNIDDNQQQQLNSTNDYRTLLNNPLNDAQEEKKQSNEQQIVTSRTESNETNLKIDGGQSKQQQQITDQNRKQTQSVHQPLQYHYVNQQLYQMPPSNCAIKEAYVHKMVKVNDDDRWSLISLGVQQSELNCRSCCQCNPCASQSSSIGSYAQVAAASNGAYNLPNKCQQGYVSYPANLARQQFISGKDSKQLHHQYDHNKGYVQGVVDYMGAFSQHNCNFNAKAGRCRGQQQQQHHHPNHHQSPLSIELKFVDRMRRKFEFSVDSFQIILDSLIQFYDCVPTSTISSRKSSSRSSENRCALTGSMLREGINNQLPISVDNNYQARCSFSELSINKQQQPPKAISNKGTIRVSCSSYYQPISFRNAISPSSSSVASSSGCSSSSSVVSSSSFSCDEDHDDLYCDADSASSSAASTSSLLSSATAISSLSSPLTTTQAAKFLKVDVANTTSTVITKKAQNESGDARKLVDNYNCNNQEQQLFKCRRTSCAVISENFYPTVIGRSEYGNFKEALYHLEKKLIATRNPEEIRGGGLLKYCNLLVKNYKPVNSYEMRTLERYMCSRFFIDFSDLNQQQAKLESYLANHFSDDVMLKFNYLNILHEVVQRSTVCLMNHELRLTLNMIRGLAFKVKDSQ